MTSLNSCGKPSAKNEEAEQTIEVDTFSQNNKPLTKNDEQTNEIFSFDGWMISSAERTVYKKQLTGGTDYDENGHKIHWSGSEYVPEEEIDFETTSLIFMGGVVAFKEFFPIKTADISSLQVVYNSIGYDNEYTIVLSSADKKLYSLNKNRVISQTDISDFNYLRKLIFKHKNGKLHYIHPEGYDLCEITIPVDEATIQHVAANYFVDKNGLYFFDSHKEKTQKLERSKKFIQPILHEECLVYDNAAYPYATAVFNQKDLRLNAKELSSISTPYSQFIGDKNNLFPLQSNTNSLLIGSISPKDIIQKGMPPAPLNKWKCFDIITVGGNLKKNVLYYSSEKHYAGGGSRYSLVKTPDGFYGISGSSMNLEAVKFDDIMIYNLEKNDYESIDVDQFRRLSTQFYIYKNRLYASESCPVETELNLEKLHPILHYGKATEFYTDGTFLLGGSILSEMKIEQRNNQKWYLSESLFRDVDWKSLQVLSDKLLIDKNNIYQVNNAVFKVIPIKSLKLDVKAVSVAIQK